MKPREFWIAGRSDGTFSAHQFPCIDMSGFYKAVRVIEYSALESLTKENEILKAQLAKCIEQRDLQTQYHCGPDWTESVITQIEIQNKELEEKLEIAKEALREYQENLRYNGGHIAQEALKKIEGK